MKKYSYLILLIGIFILFAYFRFFNLQNRIIFDWDQEHYAYEIKNIVKNHKFTLIGPRANNDKGFFLGPYFTYLMLPFYLVTNLHPYGSIYFVIVYNLLFYCLSFLIINNIFGNKQAILFLFFWTINNLLAVYDILPWWPLYIPLGTILVWHFLWQSFKKNHWHSWFFLGLTLGIFSNFHFQFVFLILFSAFFIWFNRQKKFYCSGKKIGIALGGFLLTLTPLIFFDLRHNFLNLKLLFNFFLPGTNQLSSDYYAWLPVFTNFLQPLIYEKSNNLMMIFYLLFVLLLFALVKKTRQEIKSFYLATLALWLTTPIFFAFYGKRPSEYYYVFLYPFILITLSNYLVMLKNTKLRINGIVVVIIFLTISNLPLLINNLKDSGYSLANKEKIIQKIRTETCANQISLSYNVPLGRDNGFKYLLEYYGLNDQGGKKFIIIIPADEKNSKFRAGAIGLNWE